ncbi:MAG TPA: uroporphyrinogen-III C-methyltransferase [Terriglobia bacterium]|nr:uroporphyrinogen-III C-methyltransferase [Terriglobia bacterium]
MKQGFVYIVGAGPGDPDLITVKGRRCVRRADVILHDRLIHPGLLAEARPNAVVIDAGKRFGHEDQQQAEIHNLLIQYAHDGAVVCRLKGGDPFIFGRGGEEVAILKAAQIRFEVVPGVSSFTAAPAAAGIPLTHRDYTHGFLVITGSRSAGFETAEWRAARDLIKARGTVVVLMGLARAESISASLIEHGCDPNIPAAIVSRATWEDEQVRFGTLGDIHESASGLSSPAILILGNVIAFGKEPTPHIS